MNGVERKTISILFYATVKTVGVGRGMVKRERGETENTTYTLVMLG